MSEIKFAYAAHGYDYAGAMERCAGDEELLRSLLEMFLADTNYVQLMHALDAGDVCSGFQAAHSLKGSSGMLGLTGLFDAMKGITEPLRHADASQALGYRVDVEREYASAIDMIKSL